MLAKKAEAHRSRWRGWFSRHSSGLALPTNSLSVCRLSIHGTQAARIPPTKLFVSPSSTSPPLRRRDRVRTACISHAVGGDPGLVFAEGASIASEASSPRPHFWPPFLPRPPSVTTSTLTPSPPTRSLDHPHPHPHRQSPRQPARGCSPTASLRSEDCAFHQRRRTAQDEPQLISPRSPRGPSTHANPPVFILVVRTSSSQSNQRPSLHQPRLHLRFTSIACPSR